MTIMIDCRLRKSLLLLVLFMTCALDNNLLVFASGVFEVRLGKFVNQAGRLRHGECCSGSATGELDTCSEPCTTSFRVCLTHYQKNIGTGTKCTFGSSTTPVLGGNTITASHPDLTGFSLIRLDFNFTWPGTFSLVIEASHQDAVSGTGKLIARMEKAGDVDANKDWKNETQTQQDKTLRYSYRVRCDQYYYGMGCSKYCRPRDDPFGHWTCSKSGEKVCLQGWKSREGSEHYCLEPICRHGCNTTHGFCKRPNECTCRDGWQGKLCDECRPYPGCAHGTCTDKFECNCLKGWGGMFCNHDLNYCTHHKPCKNGARCINVGQGSFSCECLPGFTGRECEIQDSECDPTLCKNGGRCKVVEGADYTCDCPENFRGANCETVRDKCEGQPCENGGLCIENSSSYTCLCEDGFWGRHCENIEDCSMATCLNGGECANRGSGFTCVCPPGFSGKKCQYTEIKCNTDFCQNGGRCVKESGANFRCECPDRFTGRRCEYERDPCAEMPCRNGGKCIFRSGDFRCLCGTGFQGRLCDESVLAHHDKQDTRIIVLTKNDKIGLSTAQWMTICFGAAFLLVIFVAIAVCVAYQNRGKVAYSAGGLVSNEQSQCLGSGGQENRAHISPTQIMECALPERGDRRDCNVIVIPTEPQSAAEDCGNSKSTEFLNDFRQCQKGRRIAEGFSRLHGHAYSQSDVRLFKGGRGFYRENMSFKSSSFLPSYKEACGGR